MKILLLAATEPEIGGVIREFNLNEGEPADIGNSCELSVLIGGVGLVSTTWALATYPSLESFDLVLQAGIAGSFSSSFPNGSLVEVVSERFGDLGAEDGNHFIDLFEMGLAGEDVFPYHKGCLQNPHNNSGVLPESLPKVQAISVNKVHGNSSSIQDIERKYSPDIENMEGAAFFYACLLSKVPFLQIRAISNRVERRNRPAWEIDKAVNRLNEFCISMIRNLAHDKA